MLNTSSMTRDQSHESHDHDDASSKKGYKTCDDGAAIVVPWSDLNHHVLFKIMMKLGILDFLAFSGSCKSWRSLAHSERNVFMVSTPPVVIRKSPCNKNECYFMDFEGRMSKLILPHLSNRENFGVTHGYLILFKEKTRDLLLVNPITRHELLFPIDERVVTTMFTSSGGRTTQRAILVFSQAIFGWVLVVLCIETGEIWFSIAGKGTWNNVSCTSYISDVIAFNGKIYTLNVDSDTNTDANTIACRLCELRLHPEPNLTLLKTKNYLYLPSTRPEFVSSAENLFVNTHIGWLFHELDFGEMKWVSREKTMGEYTIFVGCFNHDVAVKRESWADTRLPCIDWRCDYIRTVGDYWVFFDNNMWYFPHECLNVALIDE